MNGTQSGVGNARPRVLITSLPKSGTNLLASILDVVPGLRFQKITLNRRLHWHPLNYIQPWGQTCLSGVDQPSKVKLGTLRYVLGKLKDRCYTAGHLPYQSCVDELLGSIGIRTLFIVRDPRDVVVSQVHHVLNQRRHFLHQDYRELGTNKERLVMAILGVRGKGHGFKALGIAEKLNITWGWKEGKTAITLRFEDLVGEQGGGSSEAQEEAILRIADHIGIKIQDEQALSIGEKAFGKGSTFRRGSIGTWHEYFDEEVKSIFKREAGEHLIRMGYEPNCDW